MNETALVAFMKSFCPGVLGALLAVISGKKEIKDIKITCFLSFAVFILALIGGGLGYLTGGYIVTHWNIAEDFAAYLIKFFIGLFGFAILKELLIQVPIQIPKIADGLREWFLGLLDRFK